MKITNKKEDFPIAPEEMLTAVCVGIFDLGIQETPWSDKDQVYLLFELDAVDDKGKRFTVGNTYTKSMYEKAPLRVSIQLWRGKKFTDEEADAFDLMKLLGQSCQIQVVHKEGKNGSVYANIGSITKLGKGMQPLKPSVTPMSFDFETDGENIPEGCPKFVATWIRRSKNWGESPEQEQEPEPIKQPHRNAVAPPTRKSAPVVNEDAEPAFSESEELDNSIPF